MENDKRLLGALRTLFYPLANVLLKNKVGAAPVIHELKLAFVEAGRDKHGRGNKPASNNMISNLTGMSRPHVRALVDEVIAEPCTDEISAPPESHILTVWCNNEDYTDTLGLPRPLELGPGPGSLRALVSESTDGGKVDEYIERLIRVGSVRRRDDGTFELVNRVFSVIHDLPQIISVFLSTLASTVDKNWGKPMRDGFIMRAAHSDRLDSKKLAMIRRVSEEQLAQLLERIDDELSRHETESEAPTVDANGVELSSIGIGVYYFEKDMQRRKNT